MFDQKLNKSCTTYLFSPKDALTTEQSLINIKWLEQRLQWTDKMDNIQHWLHIYMFNSTKYHSHFCSVIQGCRQAVARGWSPRKAIKESVKTNIRSVNRGLVAVWENHDGTGPQMSARPINFYYMSKNSVIESNGASREMMNFWVQ